jgi:hypothetical protein
VPPLLTSFSTAGNKLIAVREQLGQSSGRLGNRSRPAFLHALLTVSAVA